jgi:hypothetical protein
VLITE